MSIKGPRWEFYIHNDKGDRLPVDTDTDFSGVGEGDVVGAMYEVVQKVIADVEENSEGPPGGADWVAFFEGFSITAELITLDSDGMAGPEESITKSITEILK